METDATILELNVGGTFFSTHRSTLCKYEGSMLANLFSEKHSLPKDRKGRYFLDRDPKSFEYILGFLRTTQMVFPTDPFVLKMLLSDLEYYGLTQYLSMFNDSILLPLKHQLTLCLWFDQTKPSRWRLIYRASRDGWKVSDFHRNVMRRDLPSRSLDRILAMFLVVTHPYHGIRITNNMHQITLGFFLLSILKLGQSRWTSNRK
eukprot:TRINITY_DN3163_c0_g1_i1.p1 TRINITY_DN3163_c0_g1~~TRINITY_DN3163_c0_g1_i1.p1  ORF type:complete len:222 (+),score=10.88 TRINITY_DN3163_c0_g1_i1:55-666(+)